MAVRRLHPEQPAHFEFTPDNLAWARATIAKYPPGNQASAVIPLLWRAQEQHEGWLPEPAIRYIADMLGMAYIRVYEVATFYTMFQLAPVGRVAHVQVCGTTPCMLRGSEGLIEVCKRKIAPHPHELSRDGGFSWEEVECLGSCANAPMVQIWKDTYEDLTPELFEKVLDGFAQGKPPKPGSQTGRQASCPASGPTTLIEISGRGHPGRIGAAGGSGQVAEARAAMAAAEPVVVDARATGGIGGGAGGTTAEVIVGRIADPIAVKPALMSGPRDGKGDDLGLIWGVGDKLSDKLNAMGIWHFDQIAEWTEANVAWFEAELEGFKGRVSRDKWIEQAKKLGAGWRPDSAAGERPKD